MKCVVLACLIVVALGGPSGSVWDGLHSRLMSASKPVPTNPMDRPKDVVNVDEVFGRHLNKLVAHDGTVSDICEKMIQSVAKYIAQSGMTEADVTEMLEGIVADLENYELSMEETEISTMTLRAADELTSDEMLQLTQEVLELVSNKGSLVAAKEIRPKVTKYIADLY